MVWFTGIGSSGKSTIAASVHRILQARGIAVEWLDGDVFRRAFSPDLGYSRQDRAENVRRLGYIVELLTRHGIVVLVSAVSPERTVRDWALRQAGTAIEVHVDAPLDVCRGRDTRGIYAQADQGLVRNIPGLDLPYEAPLHPDVYCPTSRESLPTCVARVLRAIEPFLTGRP